MKSTQSFKTFFSFCHFYHWVHASIFAKLGMELLQKTRKVFWLSEQIHPLKNASGILEELNTGRPKQRSKGKKGHSDFLNFYCIIIIDPFVYALHP